MKEGRYTGGGVPYGYKLIKAGRFNKRNHEVFELEIDESKSKIVKEIFYKYVFDKMGPHQIATYLTQKGIGSNNEAHWHSCSISNILKNRTYIGILKSGSVYSDPIHRLKTVDDDIFQMAQKVRANKICVYQRKPSTRAKTQGKCTGLLYCGHCGSRMTLSTNVKKETRKDGSIREYRRIRYTCYNKRRHPGTCNGQTGYTAEKLDKIVVSKMLNTFQSVQTMAGQTEIKKQLMSQVDTAQTNLSNAKYELECQYRKLSDLKEEVIRVIRGTSGFGSILLSELIDKTEAAVKDLQFEVIQLEFELKQQILCLQTFEEKYLNLTELTESFSIKSSDEQRQIISQFVRKIHIKQGYELKIEYKFNEL